MAEHYYSFQWLWSSCNGIAWTMKTGDITWRMRPCLPFKKMHDNDNLYVEFEALYDHHSSNLWKLHFEIEIGLFNSLCSIFPRRLCKINKSCYFDKCGQTEDQMSSPIRFDFGTFGSVRTSLVPKQGSLQEFIFYMDIRIVKKSTVGMTLFPPSELFIHPKNIDTEVVLKFYTSNMRRKPSDFHVDKLALISVSSVFREMFSNDPNNNNEHMISNIYNSKNGEICRFFHGFLHFLRLLYAEKQQFSNGIIEVILYLAVRYNVQFLIADCEEYLISTEQISNSKKLYLAEECDLAKLQLVALERITIEILENDKLDIFKVFDGIGPKTLKALLLVFCDEE